MQQPSLRMSWDGSGMPLSGFAPYHHSGMTFVSSAYVYGGLPQTFVPPPPPPPPPPAFGLTGPKYPYWGNNQASRQDDGIGSVGLIFATAADGRTFVSYVRPGSSAAFSGIIAERDVLEAVDRMEVNGLPLSRIGTMIVGKPGTTVNLSFLRERDGDVFKYDLELVRTVNEGLAAEEAPFADDRLTAENEKMYLMSSSQHSTELNDESQQHRGREEPTIRARERERHAGGGDTLSESMDSTSNLKLPQSDTLLNVPFSIFQSEQTLRVQRERELEVCKEANLSLQGRVEEMQTGLENAHHTIKRIEDGVHMIEQARDEERRMRHASEGEKMALQARIDELVAELIRVYENNQEAKATEIQLKEEMKQKQETNAALEIRVSELLNDLTQSQRSAIGTIEKLKETERARETLLAESEVTMAETKERNESLQKKIAELQANLQNVQDAFSVAVSVVRKAKEDEQVKRIEAEENLRKEKELTEDRLKQLKENDMKNLQNELLGAKANRDRLELGIQDLQDQVSALQKAKEEECSKRLEAERLLRNSLQMSAENQREQKERASAPSDQKTSDEEQSSTSKLNDTTQKIKTLESRIAQLLYEREQADEDSKGATSLHRLCVLALPAAVALVRELCKDTSSLSSSTWTHMRAQEYLAKVASFQSPVSTMDLVSAICLPEISTPQYHTLVLAGIFSCYSKDRLELLLDSRIVPALINLMGRTTKASLTSDSNASPALRNSFQSADRDNIDPEEREEILSSRYSAMTLSNFSLEMSGRMRILDCVESIDVLINAIKSTDKDCAIFSLICLGNVFFEEKARAEFVRRNCVSILVDALRSPDADVVRFAAGALRNFCSDPQACPGVVEVPGVHRCLQELTGHSSERVRDHSRACLTNLRVNAAKEAAAAAAAAATTASAYYVASGVEPTYVAQLEAPYSHARYILPS